MNSFQTDVFDVPAAVDTILQDRVNAAYQRTLFFQNLTASAVTVIIEDSPDGVTWTVLVAAFIVGAKGSATEIVPQNIISSNMLRVRGSGGGDDRDLLITLVRGVVDNNKVWANPTI